MNIFSAFSNRHWIITVVVLLGFGTVNALATKSLAGYYYAVIGPFAGGAYRDGQSCCADFSMSLFYIAGPVLLIGFITQMIPFLQGGKGMLRHLIWTTAWVFWCVSGWISFGHLAS
ncbi:MAG: hypothetical protein GY747_05635 [Planctomycetes bacterium]|nr:hypothetical protein [Planctomycetota bacterium]MCP4770417.1 hypothetical protein [Planctomycetota bacterium]MCP4860491.1 hypothetical protein [Planctomycetota bacterium]